MSSADTDKISGPFLIFYFADALIGTEKIHHVYSEEFDWHRLKNKILNESLRIN